MNYIFNVLWFEDIVIVDSLVFCYAMTALPLLQTALVFTFLMCTFTYFNPNPNMLPLYNQILKILTIFAYLICLFSAIYKSTHFQIFVVI